MIHWLRDEEVRQYLSDSHTVSRSIEEVLDRIHLPVLTHLFNQNGRFYMIYNRQDNPVGFVRLIPKGHTYEIVIVIGEREQWNQRLGTSAIIQSLKMVFFEFRAQKIVAKIYKQNIRSIQAFLHAGFQLETETSELKTFAMTLEHYLQIRKGESAMSEEIYITHIDRERITKILEKMPGDEHQQSAKHLAHEIDRAVVVNPEQIDGDVITMNSRALLRMDDEDVQVSLVYPQDADLDEMKLSILSPIGTAILGYREGATVTWEVPSGKSEIVIQKILYQPEAAGDYHM